MNELAPQTSSSAARGKSLKGLISFAVGAFFLAMALLGWTLMRSRPNDGASRPTVRAGDSRPMASPQPMAVPRAMTLSEAEARMSILEARLTEAQRLSGKALEDASRAERLMILAGTRRAVDRGQPLTYLEAMLQRQFGTIYPGDVAIIVANARQPVTLDQLSQDLLAAESKLATPSGRNGWIDTMLSDLRGLAVVRRADEPSDAPAKRFERAKRAMARDQVDLAAREVAAMPGGIKARAWLEKARRYVAVHAALDRLEAATLLSPSPSAGTLGPPSRD